MNTHPTSITEATELLEKKEVSSQDLVQHALQVIKKKEQKINAFLEVFEEDATQKAKQSDEKRSKGEEVGKLAGIPIAVKNNICTKIGKTNAASKILENFSATYNATVIDRLEKEGAIIIGKTNLDEFAMGASTEYSAYGMTKNPWDIERVPGGSSGGSAAAVAAGEVLAALGTDTGGSIRQPAGFCGVVGVKPTYGRVSRFGAIAYGSSLDQIGPITRTVKDSATILSVIAGADARDATTSKESVPDYTKSCEKGLKGVRIGVPKEFFDESIKSEVAETVKTAIEDMKRQGAETQEISLPLTHAGIAVYYLIAKAEVSTNLARLDALRFSDMDINVNDLMEHYIEARGKGFGPEVKRAILMGTYALSAGYYNAWYEQASKVRTLIAKEYEQAFKGVDVIASPVSPETAFLAGSKTDDPLQMYLADSLTVPMSVAGIPAISLPAGFSNNLPVGMQICAPRFQEDIMFQVAHAYEQNNDNNKLPK